MLSRPVSSRAALAALLFVSLPALSLANPITVVSVAQGWRTVRALKGPVGGLAVGETVTATFASGAVRSATVAADGSWVIPVPAGEATPTTATVTSTDPACPGPTAPIAVASLLDPPTTTGVAAHTVTGGSVTLGGATGVLSGNFTTTANAIDYDPLSPTYGDLSGSILANQFAVSASGSFGTATFGLSGNQPFTVSMLPVFASPGDPNVTVSVDVPVSGFVRLNGGAPVSFTGSVFGSSTYDDNGGERYDLTLALTSGVGPITGTFQSEGIATLVPEPGTWTLLLAGGALLAVHRRRRA